MAGHLGVVDNRTSPYGILRNVQLFASNKKFFCFSGRSMRVVVWGLGYVGTVSAACLAELGHEVIGVETNQIKVEVLNSGTSAIREPGLSNLIKTGVSSGRLRAVQAGASCVKGADVSLICVGTPSAADGNSSLDFLRNVSCEIGRGLKHTTNYHAVVVRSTVFPGTVRKFVGPILEEHSGLRAGADFGLVANPEFMREASAIEDFYTPPYTVIGELDNRSGDLVEQLYKQVNAPLYRVVLEEAELLKLTNNAFHALKTGFANEIGRVCDRIGVDSHSVMGLVCADNKLNISPAYLKPGFAFGGSCLPKDVRALTLQARRLGIQAPILEGILPSNRLQIEYARLKVHELGARQVAVLGLSFKSGTDDLRESAVIPLIRDLWQDGVDVRVYDPDVELDKMLGSNLEYLERQLPQIHQIFCRDLKETLANSRAVIVSQKRPQFVEALVALNGKAVVLDLVRLSSERSLPGVTQYRGLSW
jgi:GDP-mannose 6-dehydrogenase